MPSGAHLRTSARRVWAPAALVVLAVSLTGCGGGTTGASGAGAGHATRTASATYSTTPSTSPSPSDSYGGYPSFLPSDTVDRGFEHRVVDASARRPVLATQGDTVRVHIGDATVLASVTGPEVPVAGQQYQAPASPATWHVVLREASRRLPVDPATFQAIDEEGSVYDLTPQGDVPTTLAPGQVARFDLYSPGIVTGEGRMRWIPVGHLAPVEWDFVVETD